MIFPNNKNRTITRFSVLLAVIILAGVILSNTGIIFGGGVTPVDDDCPLSYTAVATTTTTAASSVATEAASEAKVAYGTDNYPTLTDIGYDTYRKLNYKVYTTYYEDTYSWNVYFYDFCTTWQAGCMNLDGKYATSLVNDRPGFYGVTASADKNVITYTAYTELGNVTLKAAQFRTYDNAKSQVLGNEANIAYQCSVKSLPNGPYRLCVWFDYTLEDGSIKTIGTWTPVYVSEGNAYFAKRVRQHSDSAMEKWLTEERNSLAADDVFQSWMANHGGNDLDAALRLDNITYPFYSNTERYPNNVPEWKGLAHEICPDEDATDFRKAYLLHEWMSHNLVYDERQIVDANGNKRDKSLPYRWAENGSGEYSTWNTHIGVCFDFANIYAIMCREMGVPCRIIADESIRHCYNAVYLNSRWELVDLTESVDSCYIENSETAIQKFWDNWEGSGYKAEYAAGFVIPAKEKYKIYGNEEWKPVEEKFVRFYPLDRDLCSKALLKSLGSKYDH